MVESANNICPIRVLQKVFILLRNNYSIIIFKMRNFLIRNRCTNFSD